MSKAEAKKLLAEARSELEDRRAAADRLRQELLSVQERIKELEGAERYLAELAGEPMPKREHASYSPAKRGEMLGTIDAALAVLGDGEMSTGQIADGIIAAGYPAPPRGKLVSYLSTMLSRDARVARVGKGTWRRATESSD